MYDDEEEAIAILPWADAAAGVESGVERVGGREKESAQERE